MYSFTDKCIEQAVDILIRSKCYVPKNRHLQADNTNKDENNSAVNPVFRRSIDRNLFDGIIENLFGN